ncbi:NAD(P)-dependent oxidoreductase [Kitasatospora sp. NBC_01266]|uniref:NAD(P)-dependent oxidoreductase n=1 Tax=Kitasatospora sp. NBC_01266 TaxID=2903572 RepID=UPI002E316055|nr:NAD(P)-dependent oxidoreductase [Kitasatospora sp. NBC_01266]
MTVVQVLRHRGVADGLSLPPDLAAAVEIIDIPPDGPLPPGLSAPVLFTGAWRGGMPNLYRTVEQGGVRWVHLYGAGVEELDLRRLCAGGRLVTNSAGAGAVPIAEWTMATLLAFEKQLPETWLRDAPANWYERKPLGTLSGRRLAVLGLGHIGTALAQRAVPFGVRVRGLRRRAGGPAVPGVELVDSLPELLAQAEHVVLTAPLTSATRGVIDAKAFELMTPGVHLVNVARGGLIDHDALREALDTGVVARASIDVPDPEPPPAGHWLYAHPKVRLTPHLSYAWPGSRAAHAEIFVDNLRRYLRGREPVNRVDPDAGY